MKSWIKRAPGPPGAMLLALAALVGCQSYERQPLDLGATRESWLTRGAGDDSIRSFARRLAELGGVPDTFDPADGLSLAEAEAVALVYNPDLRVARREAGVVTAGAEFAGLWEDPVLGVDLERIVRGAGGENPWVAAGTLGLTIPLSGRLEAAKARAGAHAAAELERVAAQEWAVRAALRELWMQWSAAQLRAGLGRDLVAQLREVAGLAQRQERAGTMSRLDARLFRVELAGREADQIALDARLAELDLQLRGLLGLSPQAPIEFVTALAFAGPASSEESSLRAALESSNPELRALRSQYEVAERALRVEIRKQYPDLVVGPGYGTDQGDDRVLLGVQLPISIWNRNRQAIAEARARREAARDRFETGYEQLASRLAIALVQYQAGRAQREAVEATVVPLADEQEADARRIAGLGRVDPLLLLESIKTQHDARLRLIDARAAESIGAIRLAELTGPAPTP